MEPLFVGIVVGVFLLIIIIINAVSQRREVLRAQRRQQAAKYKYRASETQDLLDGLKTLTLPNVVKQALVERILENLNTAKQIAPDYPNIDSSINFAQSELENIKNSTSDATSQLFLPNSEGELRALTSRVKRLLQIFNTLYQRGRVDPQAYREHFPKLDLINLKLEIESRVKFGRIAEANRKQGTAKQHYIAAIERLSRTAEHKEYKAAMMAKLQMLLDSMTPVQSETPAEPEAKKAENKEDTGFQEKKKW